MCREWLHTASWTEPGRHCPLLGHQETATETGQTLLSSCTSLLTCVGVGFYKFPSFVGLRFVFVEENSFQSQKDLTVFSPDLCVDPPTNTCSLIHVIQFGFIKGALPSFYTWCSAYSSWRVPSKLALWGPERSGTSGGREDIMKDAIDLHYRIYRIQHFLELDRY